MGNEGVVVVSLCDVNFRRAKTVSETDFRAGRHSRRASNDAMCLVGKGASINDVRTEGGGGQITPQIYEQAVRMLQAKRGEGLKFPKLC